MENNEFNITIDSTPESKKSLNQAISKTMDMLTFEEGIKNGLYSDEKGIAYVILNGTLYNTYNVYIDRRCITKAGSVVSFDSLIKSYGADNIQIRYDLKKSYRLNRRLMSTKAYRKFREDNKQN